MKEMLKDSLIPCGIGVLVGMMLMRFVVALADAHFNSPHIEPGALPKYALEVCDSERQFKREWQHEEFMGDDNSALKSRAKKQLDLATERYFDCMEKYSPPQLSSGTNVASIEATAQ